MIPKNSPDRRKAFYTFLIFLLVSIIIIAVTLFYSTSMRSRQLEQLLEQANLTKNDQDFSKRFSYEMFKITNAIDTINETPNFQASDNKISTDITHLNAMVDSFASTNNKNLYQKITNTLSELQKVKREKHLANEQAVVNDLNSNTSKAELSNQKTALEGKIKGIRGLLTTYPGLNANFVSKANEILNAQ